MSPSVFGPVAISFSLLKTEKPTCVSLASVALRGTLLLVFSSRLIPFWMFGLVTFVTSCTAAPRTSGRMAPPSENMTPIVIGQSFVMDSSVLGEKRTITVYLPSDYHEGSKRYPLLYLLDGGADEDFHHITGIVQVSVANGLMEPIVVIGIKNTVRRRDMTGPTTNPKDLERGKDVGRSVAFRSFLKNELVPRVERDLRGNGNRTLLGESLAGLFVVETFLEEPGMFDRYIAVSPSLWWNNDLLVKTAPERLKTILAQGKTFYLTVGGIDDNTKQTDAFAESLRQTNPPGLVWFYEPLPNEAHGTMLHAGALRALRKFFPAKVEPAP